MTHEEIVVQEVTMSMDPCTSVHMRYSGFWVRLAAHIIDGFVVSMASLMLLIPISMVFAFIAAFDHTSIVDMMGQITTVIAGTLLGWTYHIVMIQRFGATLGKMAVGARVCSENGAPLETSAIIMRETVGKIASALSFLVGYFMIAFTDKKQGLHDIIGKTVVVYADPIKGPNRLAVWIVYGVHLLCVLAFVMIMTVIVSIILFFIGVSDDGSGQKNDWQWDEVQNDKGMEELQDAITGVIQQS
jgi:uncharacterized RDD family membrane protein YckC